MTRFKDPKKLAKYLEIALGELQKETIVTTQARLGSTAVSPVDTGRFRASWFAAEGTSSNEVAPEADSKGLDRLRRTQRRTAAKNAGIQALGEREGFSQNAIDSQKSKAGTRGLRSYSPQTDAEGLSVDASRTYHLTNNLPYAEMIAVEGRVVSKSPTWFTSFRNNDIPKIGDEAARKIKRRFQL